MFARGVQIVISERDFIKKVYIYVFRSLHKSRINQKKHPKTHNRIVSTSKFSQMSNSENNTKSARERSMEISQGACKLQCIDQYISRTIILDIIHKSR